MNALRFNLPTVFLNLLLFHAISMRGREHSQNVHCGSGANVVHGGVVSLVSLACYIHERK